MVPFLKKFLTRCTNRYKDDVICTYVFYYKNLPLSLHHLHINTTKNYYWFQQENVWFYNIIHPNSTFCRDKSVHTLYSVKDNILVTTNAVIKLIAWFNNIRSSSIRKLTSLSRKNLIGALKNQICDSWHIKMYVSTT